ncbi:MAG: hypothetical protein ABIK23_02265 [candidate division WOR-3 bacterium]
MKGKDKSLSDVDVALYALYILGGWHSRIHTEDIAIKCFELAKSKFSWIKYPQYPDITPARYALEAAKKPKNGALVEGASERGKAAKKISGWMLTENGIKWIQKNKARIEESLGSKGLKSDRLLAERKITALKNSVAFQKFLASRENANLSYAEIVEALLCTVNTSPQVITDRIKQLLSIAEEMSLEDVKQFLQFIGNKYEVYKRREV